ncbi:MAG TPA: hypothetical protein VKK81_06300 [Candidatus Binatia bacterium]|nr:hypothetical protein [Candidatus Binatia bacterium]
MLLLKRPHYLQQGGRSRQTLLIEDSRRLQGWLQKEVFLKARQQLAHRYEALPGINWDQVLLDGVKRPAKRG